MHRALFMLAHRVRGRPPRWSTRFALQAYFRACRKPCVSRRPLTLISTRCSRRYRAAQRKAAVICRHCPVIAECGADALDNRVEFGVWGGMTERQRRALLKQHPDVSSWAEFFAGQRKHRIVS